MSDKYRKGDSVYWVTRNADGTIKQYNQKVISGPYAGEHSFNYVPSAGQGLKSANGPHPGDLRKNFRGE